MPSRVWVARSDGSPEGYKRNAEVRYVRGHFFQNVLQGRDLGPIWECIFCNTTEAFDDSSNDYLDAIVTLSPSICWCLQVQGGPWPTTSGTDSMTPRKD